MRRDLTNKVMIITGASSGIGAATAVACAAAGMDVVLNARRADRLSEVATRVHALGRKAEIVAGDVGEAGISARMLDAAEARFGRFDFVFANAGYGFERGMIEVGDAELRAIFDVNFFAGVDLLQRAARRLVAAKRPGHLLMCSSCLAKFSLPMSGPYCATKAAQNQVCRAMGMELRSQGIFVSSVHPIGTRTEFFETSAKRIAASAAAPPPHSPHSPGSSEPVAEEPPGFFMQPAERVANAVVKCLRRPRPEVWTSFLVRTSAALMMLMPGLTDFVLRKKVK